MEETKFFLHQIKHTNNIFDKGIVVKDTFEATKQSYRAYLDAYAYGQNPQTDFVSCMITNDQGTILMGETWKASTEVSAEA